MRAVMMRDFGGPECLALAEAPDPILEGGWVSVRLEASALNWHDVLVRQGAYASPLPHIPGSDGAGTRLDTGEEVIILPSLWWGSSEAAPAPGWQILGDHIPGTHAELVRVPEDCIAPKPAGLDWLEAAALPLAGLTAYRALLSRGRLTEGESMLVLGAGGGVAGMALGIATAIGASTVVTSSSQQKIDQAVARGAVGGVCYTHDEWWQAAAELTPGGAGFDLVLDPVGSWREAISALRPGGRAVVLGASVAEQATLDVRRFYFGQYDLLGTTMGSPRDFGGLLRLVDSHGLAPPLIDRAFALGDVAEAHRHLESGSGSGKVVLTHR